MFVDRMRGCCPRSANNRELRHSGLESLRRTLLRSQAMTEPAHPLVAAVARSAAAYPGALEAFPWGERVAKVGGRVFVFLGSDTADDPSITLKLPESGHYALSLECCTPTGYGLGKAGWVTIQVGRPSTPERDLLLEWLDESYRSRAGSRHLAMLDADPSQAQQKRP